MTDLFEQGRNLGKLEMKPLIRELIEALEEDYNRTAETMHLIDRAKEALDDPPHSGMDPQKREPE